MALALLEPNVLMLTGGFGRSGRETAVRVLIKGQAGWNWASVDTSADWGARLYHSMTAVPGWGALVFGGRSSPLKPFGDVLSMTYDLKEHTASSASMSVSIKEIECSGCHPQARWRHSATLLKHNGRNLLFVFGGRTEVEPVLGDFHFLDLEAKHWTKIPVEAVYPEPRHSHSSCAYQEGAVIFGGLGRRGIPLGDTILLKPTSKGFCWETLEVHPPVVPRYSHSAHVIGEQLVVVGGVWLQAESVPGVAVINLCTGASVEYCLDTLDQDRSKVTLIGGGGNCFSFGTHLNSHPVTVDLSPAISECATSLAGKTIEEGIAN